MQYLILTIYKFISFFGRAARALRARSSGCSGFPTVSAFGTRFAPPTIPHASISPFYMAKTSLCHLAKLGAEHQRVVSNLLLCLPRFASETPTLR